MVESGQTPRLGHAPIEMRHVGPPPGRNPYSVYDGYDLLKERGDFFWQVDPEQRRRLVVAIPVQRHGVDDGKAWTHSHWTIDHKNHCDAQWSWDGNEKKPTLHPSLHAGGIWHGWVTEGMLKES